MRLYLRFAFAVLVGSVVVPSQDPTPPDPLRDTVRGALAWISKQAVPVRGVDGAVLFPASEGSKQLPQTNVYGGSAGVLIFLENAAAVFGDAAARELADRTAKGLRSARRVDSHERASWTKGSAMGVTGLYTGDAGVGQAFLVRHALRGDAEALATAIDIGDALLARARDEDGALSWDKQPDIIFGNAGTALFLLELGLASKAEKFLDAARAAGRGLLAEAVRVPSKPDPARKLPTWVLSMGGAQIHMPNFSHGTAGVAYALARIGAQTGDAELLQAGVDGAQWLIENAVVDGEGLKWAASDQGHASYMAGWCHGPPGTGRLFLLLHAITGEARYLDVARKGARFVIDYAANAEKSSADGEMPYVPPSFCCGAAGVVDFFCDLTRVTHDATAAAFAKKAGDYLIEVAVADGDGRKWKNGRSAPGGPVAASSTGYNVDLMLGAAGEALALLRLMTIDRAEDPVRSMPDRTVAAPRAKK
ncbi:MAG TPA: lanthionine synthetase LanC family protein [Planctomycetota bacterium]|nr:lanthionine synthetase LanC family protein [Planctomycetota bacterium]